MSRSHSPESVRGWFTPWHRRPSFRDWHRADL